MIRAMGGLLTLSMLIAAGTEDISGQQTMERRGSALRRAQGVETIMRMREQLELTDDQIAALEAIRGESVQWRNAVVAELSELRSQVSAGQIERSTVMVFTERQRDAAAAGAEDQRTQLESILSETQRASIRELRARARVSARRGASSRWSNRQGRLRNRARGDRRVVTGGRVGMPRARAGRRPGKR